MKSNSKIVQACQAAFKSYLDKYEAVEVINLSTTDGFPIYNQSNHSVSFDAETLAAASSTLYSVSSAVSKQILSKNLKITFIEADLGCIGFILLQLESNDFVLSMSANETMNIGQLRVFIHRLSEEIKVLHKLM